MESFPHNKNGDGSVVVQDLQADLDPTFSDAVQPNKLASGALFDVSNTRQQSNERMQILMFMVGYLLIMVSPIALMFAGQHGMNVSYVAYLILITVSDFDIDSYMAKRPRLCLIGPLFIIWFCMAVYISRYDMTEEVVYNTIMIWVAVTWAPLLWGLFYTYQCVYDCFVPVPGQHHTSGKIKFSVALSVSMVLLQGSFCVNNLVLISPLGKAFQHYQRFPPQALSDLSIVYGVSGTLLAFVVARAITRQRTDHLFGTCLLIQGSSYAINTIVMGVYKSTTMQSHEKNLFTGWQFDVAYGVFTCVVFLLVYFYRGHIFGLLSRLIDRGTKITAAKTLGKLFAPSKTSQQYTSQPHTLFPSVMVIDVGKNRRRSAMFGPERTPLLSNRADVEVGVPSWLGSAKPRFGSTDYFVVAADSVDVPLTLKWFVQQPDASQSNRDGATFWTYECLVPKDNASVEHAVTATEHLPVVAAGCKKCLVLLNEDLFRDPLALLQLLSGLVVHAEIELLPCGKYWSIFSKAIDKALVKWNLDAVVTSLEKPLTSDTLDTTQLSLLQYANNTMTMASRQVLTQVLNHIGDADSFNSVMLRLRELVELTRDKVRKSSVKFNFEEVFDVLFERNLASDETVERNGLKSVRVPRELSRSSITLLETIGVGNFGEVRRALFNPEDPQMPEFEVAVKTTKHGTSNDAFEEMRAEAVISAQLVHENVVQLVGVVTVGAPMLLVMQMCSHGALTDVLRKLKTIDSNAKAKQDITLGLTTGVADGMKYLASLKFVHRDLACRNVLVSANGIPKISDFGLSRMLGDDNEYYKMASGEQALPIRWIAVEIFTTELCKFTEMSDCWSFAMLCVESFQFGVAPYPDIDTHAIVDLVKSGYIHTKPDMCPLWFYDAVIVPCLNTEPQLRPSFETICDILTTSTAANNVVADDNLAQSQSEGEKIRSLLQWTAPSSYNQAQNTGMVVGTGLHPPSSRPNSSVHTTSIAPPHAVNNVGFYSATASFGSDDPEAMVVDQRRLEGTDHLIERAREHPGPEQQPQSQDDTISPLSQMTGLSLYHHPRVTISGETRIHLPSNRTNSSVHTTAISPQSVHNSPTLHGADVNVSHPHGLFYALQNAMGEDTTTTTSTTIITNTDATTNTNTNPNTNINTNTNTNSNTSNDTPHTPNTPHTPIQQGFNSTTASFGSTDTDTELIDPQPTNITHTPTQQGFYSAAASLTSVNTEPVNHQPGETNHSIVRDPISNTPCATEDHTTTDSNTCNNAATVASTSQNPMFYAYRGPTIIE